MKSAGTEHSKNKYTLKKIVNTFNQFVRSIFSILFYTDCSIVFLIVIQNVTSNYYCFHKSYDFICI